MAQMPINLRVTGSVMVVEGVGPFARMEINVPLTASALSINSISITSGSVAGDLIINGTLIANEFKTTVVSASIMYRSGSTKQGDSLDDTHEVTGSLRMSTGSGISGSLSGSFFGAAQGSFVATEGVTGSLQRLVSGLTYLVGGARILITTASNGQVIIAAEAADVSASYVTIGNTGSLPNERALIAGTGIRIFDGGPGNIVSASIDDNVVATVSGALFAGPVQASTGLSGSLQQLFGGTTTYLAGGPGISVTTQSNGQVVIGNTFVVTQSWADVSASYVVLGVTGSLPNERALSASFGLLFTDSGPGGNVALRVNDNDVATLSGSTFRGTLFASGGLTGSLQQLAPLGPTYLAGGFGTQITTASNGQVQISHQYRTTTVTGDVTASNGLTLVDATGAAVNVCLPDATQNSGRPMYIKKIDVSANFVNVGTINAASQLIDGAATQSFNTQWTSLTVIASGSNWYIV